MKEFILDTEVTPVFLDFLKNYGSLEMLPGLGEGFYKLKRPIVFQSRVF
jgi:hypothetical protein